MYKTKLQELCHQQKWSLPAYSVTKQGPPHASRFKASVIVNGDLFTTLDFCKTSKDAQNDAAMLAFQHFNKKSHLSKANNKNNSKKSIRKIAGSSSAATESGDSKIGEGGVIGKEDLSNTIPLHRNNGSVKEKREFRDVQSLYKTKLQLYAQKRSLNSPVYSFTSKGLPHALRFNATVTVDKQTFESPQFHCTLKEAEYAAAKVAISSLSKNDSLEDDCTIYKTVLQELTQKVGISLPVYNTKHSGHPPTFISTVEVNGDVFHGLAAKTKKQAEMSAAKVAYYSLKESHVSNIQSPLTHQNGDSMESLECIYLSTGSDISVDFQNKLDIGGIEDHLTISSVKLGTGSELGNRGDLQDEPSQEPLSPSRVFGRSIPELDTDQAIAESKRRVDLQNKLDIGGIEDHLTISSVKLGTGSESESGNCGDLQDEPSQEPLSPSRVFGRSIPELDTDQAVAESKRRVHLQNKLDIGGIEDHLTISSVKLGTGSESGNCGDLQDEPSQEPLSREPRQEPLSPSRVFGRSIPELDTDQTIADSKRRVVIYPRKPNMEFPEGSSVLPISDDKWVAVSFD
ncbi:hypothetical protein ACHQM5_019519 [Ranunculus cassubicifolius]